jgi:hypothetical protein
MTSSAFAARLLVVFVLLGGAGASTPLRGQTAPPARSRCDTPEFRQFDFWVGDWNVTSGDQPVGTNLVTLEEDGCVVHEHWTGARGGTGQSFNYYDRVDRQWHQQWVSNSGNVLDLAGTLAGGTLTLHGERRQPDGSLLRHRLSFRANSDGTVRQLWETSSDSGATWAVSFDGLYRKKKG